MRRCRTTSPASSSTRRRCARTPPTARRWSTSSRHRRRPRHQGRQGRQAAAGAPGETITEGLDGLRERLAEYYELGARFAKWRGVISISDDLPTWGASSERPCARPLRRALPGSRHRADRRARSADGRQPGNHSIDRCDEVTVGAEDRVRRAPRARVELEGMVLKPNMVIDGKAARRRRSRRSPRRPCALKATVPSAVPGIAFLSGGQSDEEATAHLSP